MPPALGLLAIAYPGGFYLGSAVRLQLGGEAPEPLWPDDRVRFSARLHAPRGFANPGGPDPARRAAAEQVVATAGLGDPSALVRSAEQVPASPVRALAAWQDRM